MSKNYSKALAYGEDNYPKTNWPSPLKAQARYYTEAAAPSSVITLTDNTTQIEIGAGGQNGVIMKWVTVGDAQPSVLTTNFDHFIPANQVRQFVVPKESQGVTSIVGVNVQNGLYKRVAYMNVGGGSVIATEY